MKPYTFTFLIFFLFCSLSLAQEKTLSDLEIKASLNVIFDGDTVNVSINKDQKEVVSLLCENSNAKVFNCDKPEKDFVVVNVRLFRTDSPETKKEEFVDQSDLGALSKKALTSLLKDEEIFLVKVGLDPVGPFGRLLAEIFLKDGLNVNLEMVRQGWSFPFVYVPVTALTYKIYIEMGLEALANQRGLYSVEHIDHVGNIPPHEARMINNKRGLRACFAPVLAVGKSPAKTFSIPFPVSGFYNQDVFPSNVQRHEEAFQRVFYDRGTADCPF